MDGNGDHGANPVVVEFEWGTPIDPGKVEETLKANPDAVALAFVHSETSTGVLNDMCMLKEVCSERGIRLCMDCVSSIGTVPVDEDRHGFHVANQFKAHGVTLDEKRGISRLWNLRLRIGPGNHDGKTRAASTRGKPLVPVDYPVVAIFHGSGLDQGGI